MTRDRAASGQGCSEGTQLMQKRLLTPLRLLTSKKLLVSPCGRRTGPARGCCPQLSGRGEVEGEHGDLGRAEPAWRVAKACRHL